MEIFSIPLPEIYLNKRDILKATIIITIMWSMIILIDNCLQNKHADITLVYKSTKDEL